MTFAVQTVWRDWIRLGEATSNLVIAPLFHITGLIGGPEVSRWPPRRRSCSRYRFDPATTSSSSSAARPTSRSPPSPPSHQALMTRAGLRRGTLGCLRAAHTGGAPVAPAVVGGVARRPACLTTVRPDGDDLALDASHRWARTGRSTRRPGRCQWACRCTTPRLNPRRKRPALPPGEMGEIVAQRAAGRARLLAKPDETATALPDGGLHTGDVGFVDADGWVYIVDRRRT